MCFAVAGMVASVAGGLTRAVGAIGEGRARRDIGRANAESITNQRINDELETREQIRRERITNRKARATARNMGIKTGFSIDAGTPIELLVEQAKNQEVAIQDKERALQVRGNVARHKAAVSIFEGEAANTAGKIGAVGSIFEAGGDALSVFSKTRKPKRKNANTGQSNP